MSVDKKRSDESICLSYARERKREREREREGGRERERAQSSQGKVDMKIYHTNVTYFAASEAKPIDFQASSSEIEARVDRDNRDSLPRAKFHCTSEICVLIKKKNKKKRKRKKRKREKGKDSS